MYVLSMYDNTANYLLKIENSFKCFGLDYFTEVLTNKIYVMT